MFGRDEKTAKRRVLFINFPSKLPEVLFEDRTVDDFISSTEVVTEGFINRYKVSVRRDEI